MYIQGDNLPGKNLLRKLLRKTMDRLQSWTVVDGSGELISDNNVQNINRGNIIHILKGQEYSVKAITNSGVIEVQVEGLGQKQISNM